MAITVLFASVCGADARAAPRRALHSIYDLTEGRCISGTERFRVISETQVIATPSGLAADPHRLHHLLVEVLMTLTVSDSSWPRRRRSRWG